MFQGITGQQSNWYLKYPHIHLVGAGINDDEKDCLRYSVGSLEFQSWQYTRGPFKRHHTGGVIIHRFNTCMESSSMKGCWAAVHGPHHALSANSEVILVVQNLNGITTKERLVDCYYQTNISPHVKCQIVNSLYTRWNFTGVIIKEGLAGCCWWTQYSSPFKISPCIVTCLCFTYVHTHVVLTRMYLHESMHVRQRKAM